MIKTLAKSIREYKIPSILTPVLVMLEVLFEVIIPFIMAKLVDEGISAGNMSVILKLGTFLLLSAFLALVSGALAGKTAAHASAGFAKEFKAGYVL